MSGLVSTSRIVSGFTSSPELRHDLGHLAVEGAGIQRMSSGTSVPRPRTSRTMGPRLTESIHTVARSTVGAAGFKLGELPADRTDRRNRQRHDDDPLDQLLLGDAFAFDIHRKGSHCRDYQPNRNKARLLPILPFLRKQSDYKRKSRSKGGVRLFAPGTRLCGLELAS